MKKLLLIGILFSSIFTVGCRNDKEREFVSNLLKYIEYNPDIRISGAGCGSGYGLVNTDADEIEGQINKGKSCGPDLIYPGFGYEVVDDDMETDGHVVIRKLREVTSSDGSTVYNYEYIGLDVSDFEEFQAYLYSDIGWHQKKDALNQFFSYSFQKFNGYLLFDPEDRNYKYQNDHGDWVNFSEGSTASKDLELMGSRIEDGNAEVMGEKLSNKYGLSVDRGQEVAKTMAAYNSLISKRALTSREENYFSNSLLGVDYDAAKKGLIGGDSEEFDALMERAAEVNGTTPEQVGAIVNEMFL
jgi:hypothetical protein